MEFAITTTDNLPRGVLTALQVRHFGASLLDVLDDILGVDDPLSNPGKHFVLHPEIALRVGGGHGVQIALFSGAYEQTDDMLDVLPDAFKKLKEIVTHTVSRALHFNGPSHDQVQVTIVMSFDGCDELAESVWVTAESIVHSGDPDEAEGAEEEEEH